MRSRTLFSKRSPPFVRLTGPYAQYINRAFSLFPPFGSNPPIPLGDEKKNLFLKSRSSLFFDNRSPSQEAIPLEGKTPRATRGRLLFLFFYGILCPCRASGLVIPLPENALEPFPSFPVRELFFCCDFQWALRFRSLSNTPPLLVFCAVSGLPSLPCPSYCSRLFRKKQYSLPPR